MDEVGERFSAGELFVPEMLMAAQAMKGGLELLKPLLSSESSRSKGTVVIARSRVTCTISARTWFP